MRNWPADSFEPSHPVGQDASHANSETHRSVRRTVQYQLATLTPMVGGGVHPGTVDVECPIRGGTVRGLLRFWWRATRGTRFAHLADLRAAEGRIWGMQEQRSCVSVRLSSVQVNDWRAVSRKGSEISRTVTELVQRQERRLGFRSSERTVGMPFGYALFPLSERPRNAPDPIVATVSFRLELSYPEAYEKDVQAAVWAWVTFGGLGGRWRRGLGALWCPELSPAGQGSVPELMEWLSQRLEDFGVVPADALTSVDREWPVVSHRFLTGVPGTVLDAWSRSVEAWMAFRQGVGVARNKGQEGRPGRSRWPEADTLRRQSGFSPRHSPIVPVSGFPRARLGLPIIFHFKDSGDPSDHTLLPRGGNRMPSPVVLRPLAVRTGGRWSAVPLVACLSAPQPDMWELVRNKDSVRVQTLSRDDVVNPRFAGYDNAPMRGLSGSGDSLEAFVRFVEQRWNER